MWNSDSPHKITPRGVNSRWKISRSVGYLIYTSFECCLKNIEFYFKAFLSRVFNKSNSGKSSKSKFSVYIFLFLFVITQFKIVQTAIFFPLSLYYISDKIHVKHKYVIYTPVQKYSSTRFFGKKFYFLLSERFFVAKNIFLASNLSIKKGSDSSFQF